LDAETVESTADDWDVSSVELRVDKRALKLVAMLAALKGSMWVETMVSHWVALWVCRSAERWEH
jgi:hypothetical protein